MHVDHNIHYNCAYFTEIFYLTVRCSSDFLPVQTAARVSEGQGKVYGQSHTSATAKSTFEGMCKIVSGCL